MVTNERAELLEYVFKMKEYQAVFVSHIERQIWLI
jgi:hypothetical protein